MLKAVSTIEKEISSPFSVLIHGDFNNDNLLYDESKNRIYYIDIHRSTLSDYIQDISVFIVSNFRMPIFDTALRDLINDVIKRFYIRNKHFAELKGDMTFDIRLAFGLARSFFTSTRFALNKKFAKSMFNRSHYLLESILNHKDRPWEEYRLSKDIIEYNNF
jgi:hypothetical protein